MPQSEVGNFPTQIIQQRAREHNRDLRHLLLRISSSRSCRSSGVAITNSEIAIPKTPSAFLKEIIIRPWPPMGRRRTATLRCQAPPP